MKKILFGFVCLGVLTAYAGGDNKYPVIEIPDSLKQGVDVVLREDHMTYTIHSRDRATWYVRQVVTILNENGKRYASEVIGYDKLSKVTLFKATSYDAAGEVIKKLKPSEIYDQSAYDGFSLYSDNRLKAAELSHGSYPFTVEFEYEIDYKFLFFIPGFVIVPSGKVSVQNSSYQLIFPTELKPKYKVLNFEDKPELGKTDKGLETVKWIFKNIKPISLDPMGPPSEELIPQILASPTLFDFDGFQGSAKTWDEFGQWILSLNKNRNVLPPETKLKLQELTANLKTNEEKIKAVYEYMQGKTRYVSIQLGIGGFQPFEASLVDKVGYGDCKALSNYMVSMLETVGIKSNYVLIEAGRGGANLQEDFPGSQFNHAVVMVPNGRDTLWLECTSQTNPFGYMGTFTGDRKAMAITDNGAKVVRTPSYPSDVNLQLRSALVTVSDDGNAKAIVKTKYSGLKYESDGLSFILEDQFDEQKKWVERTTDIPSFNINSFKIENKKAKIPTAIVNLDLQLNRYATVNGKRMFLTPNLMTKTKYIPPKVENRTSPVVIRSGFIHIDSVHYTIPESIYAESLPETKKYNSAFGEYEAHYRIDQGKLLYVRKFRMKEGRYPASAYNELIEFTKNINKADNTKVVFVNKT
jgi:hypothetical protein